MIKKGYEWLLNEGAPKMLVEGLKMYGVTEGAGDEDNQEILDWAKEVGINDYVHDSIPWCGLAAAVMAKRAGYDPVKSPLWAANWGKFGQEEKVAMLGDILVFQRPGGNHVGLYVGEDVVCYHVLGGNEGDKMGIVRILKNRCWAVRRPIFKVAQPANVRVIHLSSAGAVSNNEA